MQNQLRASAPVNNGYPNISGSINMPQPMTAESTNVMNTGITNAQHGNNRNVPRMPFAAPRDVNELPLKMVVNAKYVGAIIGQNGSIIREISQDTKAKCIVEPALIAKLPRDSTIQAEKIVNISGAQENCSRACVRILEIVQRELIKDNPNAQNEAIELKIKVPNQLIGRLIGKHGATIKKIMEETQALISISDSQFDASQMYAQFPPEVFPPERCLSIRAGTIDIISVAEKRISQKMRQDYEADINRCVMQQGTSLMGYAPIVNAMPQGIAVDPANMLFPSVSFPRFAMPVPFNVVPQATHSTSTLEKIQLYVPSNVVGALIGSKGQFIKSMMRVTGANVRIEEDEETSVESPSVDGRESDQEQSLVDENGQKPVEQTNEPVDKTDATDDKQEEAPGVQSPIDSDKKPAKVSEKHERTVSIYGMDHQIYRAEFWVFQRIAETQANYIDEVFLSSEVMVPSAIIGKVIGKSGQNIRELQRITQACVRIPPDANQEQRLESQSPIHIHGNYFSTQAVQARLSQLILEHQSKAATVDNEPEHVQTPGEYVNNAELPASDADNNGSQTNDVLQEPLNVVQEN